ncbi:hypothetical protein EYV94_02935 [Puteibacter caeruleilacunae]|nr:hypothetical protein EYV94_02935 [Puteibacter caeruleilacunae]
MRKLFTVFKGLILMFFLHSCDEDIDSRYKAPDWLEGDIATILTNDGNYTTFLKAVDLTGYKSHLAGRANITVFAPNDEAFANYFSKHQIGGLNDVELPELKKLVAFHFVKNTYTKKRLTTLFEEPITKLPSMAKDTVELVIDERDNKQKRVYKSNKWVPLFHKERFAEAYVTDGASNFQKFFDNTYDNEAIYYANAKITDYEIPADNGYLYKIDQVVEPLETIYELMTKNEGKHDYFLSLLNEFKYFEYDKDITQKFGGIARDSLFIPYYLFDPHRKNLEAEDDFDGKYEDNHNFNINAFIPFDDALKAWLTSNVLNEDYPTLEDLSVVTKKYILNYFIAEDNFAFPERVAGSKVLNDYNVPIVFDTNDPLGKVQCASNGVYYGIPTCPDILLFNSVLKVPFTRADYDMYLYALENAGVISIYLNQKINYTSFVPHNDSWEVMEFSLDYGDANIVGDEIFSLVENDQDRPYNRSRLASLVGYHNITGDVTFTEDLQIIGNQNKFGVTFVKGNQVWSGGNEERGYIPTVVGDKVDCINGSSYMLDHLIMAPSKHFAYHIALNDNFKAFNDIIESIDGYRRDTKKNIIGLTFLKNKKYTAFIPSNEAIAEAQAAGLIPEANGEDNKALIDWLRYFFVDSSIDQRTNYLLPKENMNEWMPSATVEDEEEEIMYEMKIVSGENYTVEGLNSVTANVNTEAAHVGRGGLLYEIDKVVSYQ